MGIRFKVEATTATVDIKMCWVGSSSHSGCPSASGACSSGYAVYKYNGSGRLNHVESQCGSGTSCPGYILVPSAERPYFDTIYAYDPERRYFICCDATEEEVAAAADVTLSVGKGVVDLAELIHALNKVSKGEVEGRRGGSAECGSEPGGDPPPRRKPAGRSKRK